MSSIFKPISISLSPNTEKDDIRLALKLLFRPWWWKRGSLVKRNFGDSSEINAEQTQNHTQNYAEKLEKEFTQYFGVKYAFAFNSGRSGFMAILQSLGLNRGDQVLLQAFTCNAAVNPIIWTQPQFRDRETGAGQASLKPIFVDCNEQTFNIDIEDLKRKISPRSKVVVVQHTFGLPANMDEVLKICDENNLILIEDCAHSLGATYKGKKVGTFGKAAFFSFSRDKVISSVYGGMVVTNDDVMAEEIKKFQENCGYAPNFWIFQQLLHPILMNYLILPTYRVFGKYLLVLFQWFRVLSKAVHWKEKIGKKPGYFPKRMSNALAILALNQFQKLERFNKHRKQIADFYFQKLKDSSFELPEIPEGNLRESKGYLWENGNIFLRFAIKHPKAHQIIKKAWRKNILIGDWYTSPIAPDDTQLNKVGYKTGSCPNAEKLAKITLNLPTHINTSQKQAEKIVNFLQPWK